MKMVFDQKYPKHKGLININHQITFIDCCLNHIGCKLHWCRFFLYQLLNLSNYDKLVEGNLVESDMALISDLILGLVQYWVVRRRD